MFLTHGYCDDQSCVREFVFGKMYDLKGNVKRFPVLFVMFFFFNNTNLNFNFSVGAIVPVTSIRFEP